MSGRSVRLAYVITVAAAVLLIAHCVSRTANPQGRAAETQCLENLRQIFVLLRESIPVEPNYPSSLNELGRITTNANLFICPSTGHAAGEMINVERWSD